MFWGVRLGVSPARHLNVGLPWEADAARDRNPRALRLEHNEHLAPNADLARKPDIRTPNNSPARLQFEIRSPEIVVSNDRRRPREAIERAIERTVERPSERSSDRAIDRAIE